MNPRHAATLALVGRYLMTPSGEMAAWSGPTGQQAKIRDAVNFVFSEERQGIERS